MSYLAKEYEKRSFNIPDFHFVFGSGISTAWTDLQEKGLDDWEESFSVPFYLINGLKVPTVNTHEGVFRYITHKSTGKTICFQCGRLHGYEGLSAQHVARPVKESFLAGTRKFILTNISGSLQKELPVGAIVSIKDHINFTGQNPLVGPNSQKTDGTLLGPRFPDMTNVYDLELRNRITKELVSQDLKVEEGVYLGVLGPSLETPAEVRLFAQWGASVVGMSTVWEAIALKHMGVQIAGFSLVSNFASGLQEDVELSNEDMLKSIQGYSEKMLRGFLNFCEQEFEK